jgi:hypothetical protein
MVFFYDDLALYMGTTIFEKFYTLVSFFVMTYAYTTLYYFILFISFYIILYAVFSLYHIVVS